MSKDDMKKKLLLKSDFVDHLIPAMAVTRVD